MKQTSIFAALPVLAATMLSQPGLAEPAPNSQSVIVPHSDLNLTTEAGTRTLDRRIWRAVVEVCGSAPDFDIEGKNDVRQCRRDTKRHASTQVDIVIARASRDALIRVSSVQK